jgi:hypothetical protein
MEKTLTKEKCEQIFDDYEKSIGKMKTDTILDYSTPLDNLKDDLDNIAYRFFKGERDRVLDEYSDGNIPKDEFEFRMKLMKMYEEKLSE